MPYPTILLMAFGLSMIACAANADITDDHDNWVDRKLTLRHQGRLRTAWTYSGQEKPSAIIFTLVEHVPDLDMCELWHKDAESIGIRDLAKKYRALLVTPCPLESPGPVLEGWGYNAGTCCQSNKSVDDIDFVRQLIPEINRVLHVPKLPVFAIGSDNGGMLAEALLCYNVVSQVASVGGILTIEPGLKKGYKVCDKVFKATPGQFQRIIKIHGTNDDVVPYNGGSDSEYPFLKYTPVRSDFIRWARRMKCDMRMRKRVGRRGDALIQGYDACGAPGNKVYLASVKGLGHEWPKRGDANRGCFSATRTIFKFFYEKL